MSISQSTTILLVPAVMLLIPFVGALPGEAQEPGPLARIEPVAALSAAGLTLTFAPKVADGMMLTVSGPLGVYSSREFAPGEAPTFVLVGDRGAFSDGRYKYELRTQPQVDQRLLQIAEEADDDRLIQELAREEQARVIVQAGQFTVVGGSIVIPPLELATDAFGFQPVVEEHDHGDDTHVHQ